MLRVSPTRMHLTRADIDELDGHLQAHHWSQLAGSKASNIRLSPGPGRPTRLSIVPADQNVGLKRAESSSSDLVVEDDQRSASLSEERREILEIEREIAEHSPASSNVLIGRQLSGGVDESELGSLPPTTPFATGEWPSCSHRPPSTDQPRPFSSARARRRHARSNEEPALHHEGIRPFSTQSQMLLNPVPQLVLPSAPSQSRVGLDPGAPVFVPQTQFGNPGSSSPTARSGMLSLRARHPSEGNTEPATTSRNGLGRRQMPMGGDNDQHSAFPLPSPNLERYPLLRPLSATSRGSSTPNLLGPALHPAETHSRGSSLTWRRLPSMADSAASSIPSASRQSSLDAAAEFLRMRASPLDDLTERLSRLAASRPRSVGRSWEKERLRRPSLLTGDPFRQELPSSDDIDVAHPFSMRVDSAQRYRDDALEDPVAVAMALPPSSPFAASSQAPPSTPSHPGQGLSSPQAPLPQCSPEKLPSSPPSEIKRKPVAGSAVKVYNDAKPAASQPQTPADVNWSSRRTKNRSDTVPQQSPLQVGRAIIYHQERNLHRSTYPPAPTPDASRVSSHRYAAMANQTRMRGSAQRSSENDPENDIEGTLQGLEHDRCTWLGRRENGDLDVTPPREGRFERCLS